MSAAMQRIHVIDSHTGGEPTRVVIAGGPDLGSGSFAERRDRFRRDHDRFRSAVANEPRGSGVLVGALLCQPVDPSCVAGVIFFNNVGYLGMCGHGAIGVAVTLAYLGRLPPARNHRLETPVGTVGFTMENPNRATIENVASYRYREHVTVNVPEIGSVTGDIAWGGNWFFLVHDHKQTLNIFNVETLTEYTWKIRQVLTSQGITGANGAEIDHIELTGPPSDPANDARNFMLCPGKAYDRSPCGTGTSAKLACLVAEGRLHEGQVWRQEGILGSVFEGTVHIADGKIIPHITGEAFVTADSQLMIDPGDPFAHGVPT
jgi:4-hydroxyproline epimerase